MAELLSFPVSAPLFQPKLLRAIVRKHCSSMSVPPSSQLIPYLENRGGVSCHAKSMFSVMNILELLSRQKGLTVHVSPSGTTCYITSMMFYVEIQLEKDGDVMDVKLAHFEEAPVVCDDLVQLLRFLTSSDVNASSLILEHWHIVTIGSQVCGTKTVVTVEGTDTLQKLPLSPLIIDPQAGEDSYTVYNLWLLRFSQMDFERIQISGLKLAPLYELIVLSTLKEKCSEDLSTNKSCFFVSLPDHPKHCYFINKGSEKSVLAGALVSKIPFSHPKCVPGVIEILRHQVAYNTLISSCVSEKHINEVVIDVISCREVQCHLHLNPQDPTLNSTDDFIARVVKRCMSVPVVMRAVFRNAAKVKADSETQDMDTEQPGPQLEQTTDSDSLKESPSGAGQQDWAVKDKPNDTESTEENLSTAKLETLGDNMEKK
ncbi:mediator of RNA polymerase II transcription subunit 1-like [Geospiza fortis]|uniref:Mediator of RNA polymerase II transcription subunit 1 n=1 Tax=Geospiza fortis TaxID=48883 RepID=A0A8N5ESB5_GEOFO|nr:mediator of RNA polymerase II transcription subunit 1-like [Geospiza fortis]